MKAKFVPAKERKRRPGRRLAHYICRCADGEVDQHKLKIYLTSLRPDDNDFLQFGHVLGTVKQWRDLLAPLLGMRTE